jgi:hypothetical protein
LVANITKFDRINTNKRRKNRHIGQFEGDIGKSNRINKPTFASQTNLNKDANEKMYDDDRVPAAFGQLQEHPGKALRSEKCEGRYGEGVWPGR